MNPNEIKHASPDHPIHELIASRWSPYAFDGRPVEHDKLRQCLEAARWAASSFNEQPWSYIIAPREDKAAFDQMLGCLLEANQTWAKNAGVLMLAVVSRFFTRNNKPNRVAEHDLGLAAGNLLVQATTLGLHVHQMAGINPTQARQVYQIPQGHDPYTAIAIGYASLKEPQGESDELASRDQKPRQRKPLREFVFAGRWNQPASSILED